MGPFLYTVNMKLNVFYSTFTNVFLKFLSTGVNPGRDAGDTSPNILVGDDNGNIESPNIKNYVFSGIANHGNKGRSEANFDAVSPSYITAFE